MLQGMFKVTEWRQIDVIDWLHYDVKLPMYTEHFIEAELDGRTLRDGVTSTILKYGTVLLIDHCGLLESSEARPSTMRMRTSYQPVPRYLYYRYLSM